MLASSVVPVNGWVWVVGDDRLPNRLDALVWAVTWLADLGRDPKIWFAEKWSPQTLLTGAGRSQVAYT